MKVLHVFKTALNQSYGGVEVVIDSLCQSAHHQDEVLSCEVLSLSPNPSDTALDFNGYKIHEKKQNCYVASTGFSWSALKDFKKISEEFDIIHYHFPNPFSDLMHLWANIKKPTVVTYHSDIVKQKYLMMLYQPLMRWFLSRVNAIVCTSENYLNSSLVLKKYQKKVNIIPIGISDPLLSPEELSILTPYQLPEQYFLFVGALRYYKGLHILMAALKLTPEAKVVIAGDGNEGDNLKQQVKNLGLEGQVIFLGKISESVKKALYQNCYAFIFPSHLRSEAFGISLLEAAATGKALISCEIKTGSSYINQNKKTGWVVEPSDPKALHQAMNFFMAHPEVVLRYGQAARKRYLSLFTEEKQVEAYIKLYRSLLSR